MLIDTHCHIHSLDYPLPAEEVLRAGRAAGVEKVICIGTSAEDSARAVEFAEKNEGVYAAVGVHPEYASDLLSAQSSSSALANVVISTTSRDDDFRTQSAFASKNLKSLGAVSKNYNARTRFGEIERKAIVAIGEVGLDYHYSGYDREAQIRLFEEQLQMAREAGLPVVFHVREALPDFWPVVDNFAGVRGVLHGFSERSERASEYVEMALARGFYLSLNGIATFSRDENQLAAFARIPLTRLLLETDAPYLAPPPFRGKPNQPAYVREIARFLARERGVSLAEIAAKTSENAEKLFGI